MKSIVSDLRLFALSVRDHLRKIEEIAKRAKHAGNAKKRIHE